MRKQLCNTRALLFVVVLAMGLYGHAQTNASTPIGGGSVNWQWTYASQGTCPVNGNYQNPQTIWAWTFTNFSVTVNGVTTPYAGSVAYINSPGQAPYCPPTGPTGYPTLGAADYVVDFTPGADGQGSAIQYNRGVFDPSYVVQSILYAAPGNYSSNAYTDSQTDGITSSLTNSFTDATQITYSSSVSFLGIGGTLSWTTGASLTTGDTQAFTNTITSASSVGNNSYHKAVNALNHLNDMLIVWMNPEVTMQGTSATTANYTLATPEQTSSDPSPGKPQGVDSIEVYAKEMVNGAVTPDHLNPQTMLDLNTGLRYTGPGLASLCKNVNMTKYLTSQCGLTDQCGCQTSDWTEILSHDALLNEPNTYDPLDLDTSPASECTASDVTPSSECRYVLMGGTTLAGPSYTGGNLPSNSTGWDDKYVGKYISTEIHKETVGVSWKVNFGPGGTGPSMTSGNSFTWTDSESTGMINGYAHQANLTVESDTTYCGEPVNVYMDTVYHTFAFQELTNGTCP